MSLPRGAFLLRTAPRGNTAVLHTAAIAEPAGDIASSCPDAGHIDALAVVWPAQTENGGPPKRRRSQFAGRSCYCAMRRLDRAVPIVLKVVINWFADVSRKNLLGSLAQFCSKVDVASPPVLTCTV